MRLVAMEYMELVMQESVMSVDPTLTFPRSTARDAAEQWAEAFRKELLQRLRSEIKRRLLVTINDIPSRSSSFNPSQSSRPCYAHRLPTPNYAYARSDFATCSVSTTPFAHHPLTVPHIRFFLYLT